MTIVVLTACPDGLRGVLTRWLIEISAGVFVGKITKRVREELWKRIIEMIGRGRALMVYSAATEQGYAIRTHGHHWAAEDFEGITLMRRPVAAEAPERPAPPGWSAAARRRRYGRK